ncbi:GNAT family N-acetyltransferase [Rhizobium tumorigenes]|uniref:GNAT family protein n=1 Tax=Rhizobium tumorigenes TaxID=2041385 RepID=A0AAF1KD33_9HYPH|nr:GNAT family protein [Rhizobium tumorigenes]WFR94128.1 GNAT family protein [Rhizobium tumorigenes]
MAEAVTLEAFAQRHFEALIGWFATEVELIQWAGPTLVFPLDITQCEAMLAETQGEAPERLIWTARALDGRIIGHVQLALDHRNGVGRPARVGIAPEDRGRGFGLSMLSAVVAHAFAVEGMERLELNVYTFNSAAIRTYEKLGFVHEGVRRSCARVGDERWDMAMMGLLKSEYRAISSQP